jgi:hypothetical protein
MEKEQRLSGARLSYVTKDTPVSMLTVEQLTTALSEALSIFPGRESNPVGGDGRKYVYGIRGLAKLLGCSIQTANMVKKRGVLSPAISQVGRKIIIDADMALELIKLDKQDKQNNKR